MSSNIIAILAVLLISSTIETQADCTCNDFINKHGYGYCKISPMCYVNMPSDCKDIKPSGTDPGRFFSSREACKVLAKKKSGFSAPVVGCIKGNTDGRYSGVSLDQCKEKCVAASFGCKSLEFSANLANGKCYLSSEMKETKPDKWIEPCYGKWSDIIYLEYSATTTTDGGWSDWSEFGSCSATCGSATKRRERTCTEPAPANGGAQCAGPNQDVVDCGLLEECQNENGITRCPYSVLGDMNAGSEEFMHDLLHKTSSTQEDCIVACQAKYPKTIGVSYKNFGDVFHCFCEFGDPVTAVHSGDSYRTCLI